MLVNFILQCFTVSNESTSTSEVDYHTILPDSLANVSKVFSTSWNGVNVPIEQTNILLESGTKIIDRTEAEVANSSEVTKPFIVDTEEKTIDVGKNF